MKSAIETLQKTIHGLELELKTWSSPPNYSQRIIDEVTIEIKEHEEALNKLLSPK